MKNRLKKRDLENAMDRLNLYIPLSVKNLIPDGVVISQLFIDFIRARYGSSLKQIEEVERTIEKKEDEERKVQSEILELKKSLIEKREEQARLLRLEEEANRKNGYAHYVVFKLLLQGSLLNKAEAIELAYGVRIQKKVGSWSELIWREVFTYRPARYQGDEAYVPSLEEREPYVQRLLASFYEIHPAIEYTGSGRDEKREFQNYLDLLSGTLRLCGRGHTYDSLAPFCKECGAKKEGIYFKFEEGEIRDYLSETRIHIAYKEYKKVRSSASLDSKPDQFLISERGVKNEE
jgi:hypothetical protein